MHSNLVITFVTFFQALTEAGTVQAVLDSGDVRVRYPSNCMWTMNPDTVVKVKSTLSSLLTNHSALIFPTCRWTNLAVEM